jgi:hypothetical protein
LFQKKYLQTLHYLKQIINSRSVYKDWKNISIEELCFRPISGKGNLSNFIRRLLHSVRHGLLEAKFNRHASRRKYLINRNLPQLKRPKLPYPLSRPSGRSNPKRDRFRGYKLRVERQRLDPRRPLLDSIEIAGADLPPEQRHLHSAKYGVYFNFQRQ